MSVYFLYKQQILFNSCIQLGSEESALAPQYCTSNSGGEAEDTILIVPHQEQSPITTNICIPFQGCILSLSLLIGKGNYYIIS